MRLLKPILAFVFAAMIIATSGAMASARGMAVDASGEIILCTGTGLISVQVDAEGQPIGPMHYCPECALGALMAVATGASVPVPDVASSQVQFISQNSVIAPHFALLSTARDPPIV